MRTRLERAWITEAWLQRCRQCRLSTGTLSTGRLATANRGVRCSCGPRCPVHARPSRRRVMNDDGPPRQPRLHHRSVMHTAATAPAAVPCRAVPSRLPARRQRRRARQMMISTRTGRDTRMTYIQLCTWSCLYSAVSLLGSVLRRLPGAAWRGLTAWPAHVSSVDSSQQRAGGPSTVTGRRRAHVQSCLHVGGVAPGIICTQIEIECIAKECRKDPSGKRVPSPRTPLCAKARCSKGGHQACGERKRRLLLVRTKPPKHHPQVHVRGWPTLPARSSSCIVMIAVPLVSQKTSRLPRDWRGVSLLNRFLPFCFCFVPSVVRHFVMIHPVGFVPDSALSESTEEGGLGGIAVC